MSRALAINTLIVDQFPIYRLDNYTKYSGLSQGDFDVQITKDGVIQGAYSFAISEISNVGDYKFTFTPDDTAFWKVNVRVDIDGNQQEWTSEFDISEHVAAELYDLVKRILGLTHENIFIDETTYDANAQLTSARIRLFDSKADVEAATDGGVSPPDPTPLAVYTYTAEWEGLNQYKVFKQVMEP